MLTYIMKGGNESRTYTGEHNLVDLVAFVNNLAHRTPPPTNVSKKSSAIQSTLFHYYIFLNSIPFYV